MGVRVLVLSIVWVALAACGDNVAVGPVVVELCGPPPDAPGYSAYFDGQGHAILALGDYGALDRWREDVGAWTACASEIGGSP